LRVTLKAFALVRLPQFENHCPDLTRKKMRKTFHAELAKKMLEVSGAMKAWQGVLESNESPLVV